MFSKNLKYLTSTFLNQNQLAIKLNTNRQNITKWLNNREPSFEMLIKISKIYNVSIDDLLLKDLEKESLEIK